MSRFQHDRRHLLRKIEFLLVFPDLGRCRCLYCYAVHQVDVDLRTLQDHAKSRRTLRNVVTSNDILHLCLRKQLILRGIRWTGGSEEPDLQTLEQESTGSHRGPRVLPEKGGSWTSCGVAVLLVGKKRT